MNACRKIPMKEGMYLPMNGGNMMKVDQSKCFGTQGNFPNWLVYTEASASTSEGEGGTDTIRTSS